MSWDVFVQDIPRHVASVDEIPDDFAPQPLGSRASIVDAIRCVAPFADTSDPSWVRIEGHGCDIEVSLGGDDPVDHFAFHIRGGDVSVAVVAAILARLGFRAFDPDSDTGLFEVDSARASLEKWMAFRDRALGGGNAQRSDGAGGDG
jgi:hypothetical protein